MSFTIFPMHPKHWSAVREIYAEGIATGNATFETELPDWQKWDATHRKDCRLVAIELDPEDATADVLISGSKAKVLGWAALSPVSPRHVYRGVAEVSVYVATVARGRGVGKALMEALVEESETNKIWTLQAGIFLENTPSITLHKSYGFCAVGLRRKIGKLNYAWRDVLLFERRSTKVGI